MSERKRGYLSYGILFLPSIISATHSFLVYAQFNIRYFEIYATCCAILGIIEDSWRYYYNQTLFIILIQGVALGISKSYLTSCDNPTQIDYDCKPRRVDIKRQINDFTINALSLM